MADFVKAANTAKRLVEANGRTMTFTRHDQTPADPAKPHRGATDPRATPDATVTTKAVSVTPGQAASLGILAEDGELVRRSEQILIVALGATSTDDLATFHEVLDGTELWNIGLVETLKPGDTTLLYFVGVSR